MNLKKMCASHNLILLVSLVTLALVIVLVVKQEREKFLGSEFRDRGTVHDRQAIRHKLGYVFAGLTPEQIAQIQAIQDKRHAEKQERIMETVNDSLPRPP